MKHFPLFCIALTLASVVLAQNMAQNDIRNRYRVAVLDFSVTDVTTQEPNLALGQAMAETFEAPLVQSKRFTVVTRADLDKVLTEIGLGATGIITPEQIQELGALSGAEILLTGSIIIHNDAKESYTINARFINVATGEVTVAITSDAQNSLDFQPLAERFVVEILRDYPRQGKIISVTDDEIFINLGTQTGLLEADAGGLVYHLRDINGIPFEEEIASFTVEQLSGFATKIAVTSLDDDTRVQENDIVKITTEVPPPSDSQDNTVFEAPLFVERPQSILLQNYIALAEQVPDISLDALLSIEEPRLPAAMLPTTLTAAAPPRNIPPMEEAAIEPAPDNPLAAAPVRRTKFYDTAIGSVLEAYAFAQQALKGKSLNAHDKARLFKQLTTTLPQADRISRQVAADMPRIYEQVQEEWVELSDDEQQLFLLGLLLLLGEAEGENLAETLHVPCKDFSCYYQNDYWRYPVP